MCLSPSSANYIAVGSSDSHIRIYDRRYLALIDFSVPGLTAADKHTKPVKTFSIPSTEKRHFRVTSITYSPDETELLVSYSSDHLYLFDVAKAGVDERSPVERKRRKRGDEKRQIGVTRLTTPAGGGGGVESSSSSSSTSSPPPVRRLRLRGDWSDTGPEARPEREMAQRVSIGQARPQLQATIMHRMTEVLSRMLADPRTRIGLSSQGNEISQEGDLARVMQQIQPQVAASVEADAAAAAAAAAAAVAAGSNIVAAIEIDSAPRAATTAAAAAAEGSGTTSRSGSLGGDVDDEMELENEALQFDYMKMKFVGHRNAR